MSEYKKLKSKVIKKAVKKVRGILFLFFFKKNFQRIVRSIIEVKPYIDKYIIEIIKIRNAKVLYYNFSLDYPVQFRRNHPFFDRYIFKLNNVTISIDSGIVFTSEGLIFQESYGSLRKFFLWNEAFSSIYKRSITNRFNESICFIPYKGFFHFLLEELPALLHILNSDCSIKVGINKLKYFSSNYYYESINYILSDQNQRMVLFSKDFTASTLFITQRENYSGFVHSDDIDILNKYFKRVINENNKKYFDKVYISRRKTKKRMIRNEIVVENYLKKIGFSIIYLEELTFIEQIQIIANSSTVISPHGAGLSHLCWRKKKKKVIEIFPSNMFNDCFARLALTEGYDYQYITCVKIELGEYIQIEKLSALIE